MKAGDPYVEETPADLLMEQIAAFMQANWDIQVQVLVKTPTGPGGLYALLSTASVAAPDVLPDLIMLRDADLQAAAEGGFIHPLPEIDAGLAELEGLTDQKEIAAKAKAMSEATAMRCPKGGKGACAALP